VPRTRLRPQYRATQALATVIGFERAVSLDARGMAGSKVIGVFGANGFIGRHLVRRMLATGQRTIALGRDFPDDFFTAVGGPVKTRRIDINDELETHVALQGITHVVQLINSSNPAMANKRVVADINLNVVPQVAFIESCIMAGVKHFVFISSGGTVYGIPRSKPIAEDHPTEPLNSYGLGKLTVEHYLSMLSRGTELGYTTLRVSNPFGPGQLSHKGQGLISAVLQQFSAGAPVTILGDGMTERDYIYIEDVIDALALCLGGEPLNDVVNIGSGRGRTVLEVVDAIEEELGSRIERVFTEARATDTPSNVLDVSKAEAALGWTPRTDFHDAIRLTVEAHRAQRN
jgi:UDP-glucose 4-epimerase